MCCVSGKRKILLFTKTASGKVLPVHGSQRAVVGAMRAFSLCWGRPSLLVLERVNGEERCVLDEGGHTGDNRARNARLAEILGVL